jgi:hypothetical protein
MHRGFLAGCLPLALAGDGEHALLDLYVEGGGVDTRREGVDFDRLWRAADVHGRKTAARDAANTRRKTETLLHLALQPIQFRQYVAGKQGAIYHVQSSIRW